MRSPERAFVPHARRGATPTHPILLCLQVKAIVHPAVQPSTADAMLDQAQRVIASGLPPQLIAPEVAKLLAAETAVSPEGNVAAAKLALAQAVPAAAEKE